MDKFTLETKISQVKARCLDRILDQVSEYNEDFKLGYAINDILSSCFIKLESLFRKKYTTFKFLSEDPFERNNIKKSENLNHKNILKKNVNDSFKLFIDHSVSIELKGFVINEINGNDHLMDLDIENEEVFYNIPKNNMNNNFKFFIDHTISIELKGFVINEINGNDNIMNLDYDNEGSFYNPRRKIFLLSTDSEKKLKYIVDSISTICNLKSKKCRKEMLNNISKTTFWLHLVFSNRATLNNKFVCSCIYETNSYNKYGIEKFFNSKGIEYDLNNLKNI